MTDLLLPGNENERLAALRSYGILDTQPEPVFDDLTRLAARACGTPIALVSLVDRERQWFKSRCGLEVTETSREGSFCSQSILDPAQVLVVPDSHRSPVFRESPFTLGPPHVRFYAGAPLVTREGHALGALCVIDQRPRDLSPEQVDTLRILARQVVSQIELRRANQLQKELMAELERSNRDLYQFASYAAHDLHEPVRAQIHFSTLLRSELTEDQSTKARLCLDRLHDSAQRMRRLIDDLLALASVQSRGMEPELLDPAECARAALETLAARVEEQRAQVTVHSLPRVQGDRTLLTQLFQNLLSNALKFHGDSPPRIEIAACEMDFGTAIAVRDWGIGLPPDYALQSFRAFRRLHDRATYPGSGLGLTIAHRIVERHGGRIWFDHRVRKGCRIKFWLPGVSTTSIPPRASASA